MDARTIVELTLIREVEEEERAQKMDDAASGRKPSMFDQPAEGSRGR